MNSQLAHVLDSNGLSYIPLSALLFSSLLLQFITMIAPERTFLTRVDTVYNAYDAGIDIKRRHLDGSCPGPHNSSSATAPTPLNAVNRSGRLARSPSFLYSILHSPVDKRPSLPAEITISKEVPVRIPAVQSSHPSHPVTGKVCCAVSRDLSLSSEFGD
jgi:hypothetical protein